MPINRQHHIGMSVPDIEAGIRFYRDVLGFEEARLGRIDKSPLADAITGLKDAVAKIIFLRRDNLWIEMFEFSSPEPRKRDKNEPVCEYGISHICLDVTNVDEIYAECLAKGMEFHSPPISTHGVRTTYGRDPFGAVIELQEVTDEALASEIWPFENKVAVPAS